MKAAPFEYHRPHEVDEALSLLSSLDDVKVLAGGQSLMPMMNFRYLTPAHLMDINRIPALQGVAVDGDTLTIGAMTRQCDLERASEVHAHAPLAVAALAHVGHLQTRNRGTLGGSLCHLDPAAELPGVMLALDAELHVGSSRGRRHLPMAEWSLGYMMPAIDEDELLLGVRIPIPRARTVCGFAELSRRHGDFAIAGAAVRVSTVDGMTSDARIAVIGADDVARRLPAAEADLEGQRLDAQRIARAASAARELAGIDDVHATASYRRSIAEVMVRRALEQAAQALELALDAAP